MRQKYQRLQMPSIGAAMLLWTFKIARHSQMIYGKVSLRIRRTLSFNETFYPSDAEFRKKEIRIGWFSAPIPECSMDIVYIIIEETQKLSDDLG